MGVAWGEGQGKWGAVAAILGMGNPLLDISAEVDQALLDKYETGVIAGLDVLRI